MNTLEGYLELIPPANAEQADFMSSVSAAIEDIIDDGTLVSSLPLLYDLESAVGDQLDTVGIWIGLSRKVSVPIANVYFSLSTENLGLDQGYLKGRGDSMSGVTSLDDTTYRLMLQIKIAANHWDGTLAQAQEILARIMTSSPLTKLMVIDNFDMTMTIGLAGIIPGQIFIELLKNYMSLRPAAVGLKEIIVTGASGSPLFGLSCANDYINGLDVGALGTIY